MTQKNKWLLLYLLTGLVPPVFYLAKLVPTFLIQGSFYDFFVFAPYVGLALVALLGWQINQTRIFWTGWSLAGLYFLLLHPLSGPARTFSLQAAGSALPLALIVVYSLKENRLWSDKSLARVLLCLVPLAVLIALHTWTPALYQKATYWREGPPGTGGYRIPPLAWASTGLWLLFVMLQPDQKIKPFLFSLAAALLPFLGSLQACLAAASPLALPWTSTVFFVVLSFTATTLILLHSILHMYWKKVYQDILTGVPNRQALDERLHTLTGDYCLAMVDIDHFKKFNDTYGHAEGDNVLRMVAQHLEEQLGFRVYRYGGEEFCVVFEGGGAEEAFAQMEKARGTLEKRKFRLRNQKRRKERPVDFFTKKPIPLGKVVQITISVGVSASGKKDATYESVIKKADQALYQAKDQGRNRVVMDGKADQ